MTDEQLELTEGLDPWGQAAVFIDSAGDYVRCAQSNVRATDSLGALACLHFVQQDSRRGLYPLVVEARAAGFSWRVIGEALGVTESAAFQRFNTYTLEVLGNE